MMDAFDMPDGIELRVLAGKIAYNGRVVSLAQNDFVLLTLLALRRSPVELADAVAMLWGERPPANAHRMLERCVSRIHTRFPDRDVIVRIGDAYALGGNVRCDIDDLTILCADAQVALETLSDGVPLYLHDYAIGRELRERIGSLATILKASRAKGSTHDAA